MGKKNALPPPLQERSLKILVDTPPLKKTLPYNPRHFLFKIFFCKDLTTCFPLLAKEVLAETLINRELKSEKKNIRLDIQILCQNLQLQSKSYAYTVWYVKHFFPSFLVPWKPWSPISTGKRQKEEVEVHLPLPLSKKAHIKSAEVLAGWYTRKVKTSASESSFVIIWLQLVESAFSTQLFQEWIFLWWGNYKKKWICTNNRK